MPLERIPRPAVARDFAPANAVRHRVKDGESWASLADRYGVPARDIIMANFKTLVPEEVNWYLRNYVGCNRSSADGMNWLFSSSASPGIVQIPRKTIALDEVIITAKPPPRFYTVGVEPSAWTPPTADEVDPSDAKDVVKIDPWRHSAFTIGTLRVKGRKDWAAPDPIWANEVIYYNVKLYPLTGLIDTIVVHHTNNSNSIKANETREIGRGFAAIGYHFFIEKSGDILEGRPLEVMGSHAGEGLTPGPEFDPDFGAIGIVMQGDYHHADDNVWHETPPAPQLKSLEDLIMALRVKFPAVKKVLLHKEVVRGGAKTECPGDDLSGKVDTLRKRLGL